MDNAPTMVLTLMVVGMIAGVVAIPMFSAVTMEYQTYEYNDTSLASWIRYDYGSDDYNLEITTDGTTITIGNQTGTADDMILYADEKASVMSIDGGLVIVNGYGDTPSVATADTVTITKNNGSIVITDGTDTIVSAAAPAWAYYPDKNGHYSFINGDVDNVVLKQGDNTAFAGSYAGVMAYNDYVVGPNGVGDLGLSLNADIVDNVINSVTWALAVAGDDSRAIEPIEPSRTLDNTLRAITLTPPTAPYYSGDWGYDLYGSGVKIVSYTGSAGNIVVPSTITHNGVDYSVIQLGKDVNSAVVFDNTAITDSTLTLPNTLTRIGQFALAYCDGFTGDLVIPAGVTYIGESAFYRCSGFTGNLVIPDTVTTIARTAFGYCSGLDGTLTLSNNLTTIEELTFNECNFTGDLVIPAGVTTIGNSAFLASGFTGDLVIPAGVTTIDGSAFNGTTFTGDLVIPAGVTTLGTYAFANTQFTGDVVIPDAITIIPAGLFNNCSNLESVTIPDNTTRINMMAFNGCSGLTGTLILPSTLTRIEESAFSGTGYTNLIILSNSTFSRSSLTSTSIENILNLGTADVTTTSYGMNATNVETSVPAMGYIAPITYTITVAKTGDVYDMIGLIPLIMILGVVLVGVAMVGYRYV